MRKNIGRGTRRPMITFVSNSGFLPFSLFLLLPGFTESFENDLACLDQSLLLRGETFRHFVIRSLRQTVMAVCFCSRRFCFGLLHNANLTTNLSSIEENRAR